MLKPAPIQDMGPESEPAAFRRLCVETGRRYVPLSNISPAAFRRLCVETCLRLILWRKTTQPPLGGCVLKLDHSSQGIGKDGTSRL